MTTTRTPHQEAITAIRDAARQYEERATVIETKLNDPSAAQFCREAAAHLILIAESYDLSARQAPTTPTEGETS